jgi:Carboxypeptidase regulatory-like domain/TonB-dependent Receptor Plug Domain
MLRKLLSVLTILVASSGVVISQNESSIKVKLSDKTTKETIPFANVVVEMGGIQVGVATTNIDGEAVIKPINPGKYNVKATYVGYQTVEITGVAVPVGKAVSLNLEMLAGQQLNEVEIITYSVPLIDPDTKSGKTIDRESYQNLATKNVNSVAATTAGVYQQDEGGDLNVRGARSNGTLYFVDGQKVIGSSGVPQSSVEQITTIIGGTPAEYGDATGGIISVTTRGPSSVYSGSAELITSGIGEKKGLDAYGYNFIGLSINGPLLLKKDTVNKSKKSVLGFALSGEMFTEKDSDPSAIGFYKVKGDKLADLEANPLRPSKTGTGNILNSEFITRNDLEKVKARSNVRSNTMRLNGKIQYQPTNNFGVTIGGSIDYNKRHDFVYEYALFNPSNNPQVTDKTWRVYAKITQKFNNNNSKEEEKSGSIIKNAYFTLQASYARNTSQTQDDNHKGNIFDYGYIGKFTQSIQNSYGFDTSHVAVDRNGDGINDTIYYGFFQDGFDFYKLDFTPSDVNPNGAAYTSQYYANATTAPENLTSVQAGLGLMNGDRPSNIYGLWYNTGRQYNGYGKSQNDQFRVFGNFSADIKRHALQLGFEYEQRVERSYSLNPIGLWTRMREITNQHITQLDLNNPIYDPNISGTYQTYYFNRLNDGTDAQSEFDRKLREKLGYDANGINWIDIDSYDPSTYSIDMFSAEDLINRGGTGVVSYYGYDHTGKKISGNPSLEDFLNKKDDYGKNTYQQGAYRPIYIAGYIQDRFDFKDIKFNVGLRVDRFDANQKVLKDKYLLYEAKTAGEVTSINGVEVNKPSNIGDDYVVYVDNSLNATKVVGYRDGNKWYNAEGIEVADPNVLDGINGAINPYLVNPSDYQNKKISSKVFTDYIPQLNAVPRVAFSFPISDVANFFAHYDILTQRPPGNNRFNPFQYLNIESDNAFLSNPNLKPERTTDYELGFSQILNEKKNSAITITAFYRELRNMIQVVQVFKAHPVTYTTWDNIDFGTVKGLSVSYELRRTMGVQLSANYTLQFADGTGSSTSDGVNLASSGQPNLRTTHPLDYDQRHTIVFNFDYRFGTGKDYRGPVWTMHKGSDKERSIKLLENVGANILANAGSGTPYSRQSNISQEATFGNADRSLLSGQINGSNLPWTFKVDLRIDKDIELTYGGKKPY